MPDLPAASKVKFVAVVEHVIEVALDADADLAYWRERLREDNLFPYDHHGKAALTISATDLRWMGSHTNEFTVGVAVCERPEADTMDGLYVVQAFNSSRLFAWIERAFFRTPYDAGRVQLAQRAPCRMQLDDAQGTVFSARMTGEAAPARVADEDWQGPIHLPGSRTGRTGLYFVARLSGRTETYPCAPGAYALEIAPRAAHPVFGWLRDSNLTARQWRIRNDALHARSSTFQRAQQAVSHVYSRR